MSGELTFTDFWAGNFLSCHVTDDFFLATEQKLRTDASGVFKGIVLRVLRNEQFFRIESVRGLKALYREPVYFPDGTKFDPSKIEDVCSHAEKLRLAGVQLERPEISLFYLCYIEPTMFGENVMIVDFDSSDQVVDVHFPG